jgi:hypothetical protein
LDLLYLFTKLISVLNKYVLYGDRACLIVLLVPVSFFFEPLLSFVAEILEAVLTLESLFWLFWLILDNLFADSLCYFELLFFLLFLNSVGTGLSGSSSSSKALSVSEAY